MALRPKRGQNSRPKASRTSTHKVRTGCLTCKKRHLKCDEARPYCGNCLRSHRQCEGYVETRKSKPSFGQFCWDSKSITRRSPSPRAQLHLDRDLRDFKDPESILYFNEFVGLVQGPWIAAVSGSDLWHVTLPQLSRDSSTLRHAAMAIGALSIWHRQSKNKSLSEAVPPALPAAEGDAHYFHAISHYGQSLRLQSRQSSVQDAAFLSILLLQFESLRGNRKAALDHLNHGMALLVSLVADPDHGMRRLAPNPKPLLTSISDIFTALAPQTRMVLRDRLGNGLPLPNFTQRLRLKNHTMQSFLVMLSQLPHSSADLADIPTLFHSLDEFQRYWSATCRDQVVSGSIMLDIVRSSNILVSGNEDTISNFLTSLTNDPRFSDFYNTSRHILEALNAAFLPLFNKIMLYDTWSPEYLRAIHLRLQFLGVFVLGDTPRYLTAESINSQTPLFREFLSLAEIALRMAREEVNNPAHQMTFECSLTLHLLLVSTFCRDPVVRDQAVEMLRYYPGQDGLFPTRTLHLLALRNRKIERGNAAEGTPEEQWRRLWRREYLFEDGGDRIVLRYMEKNRVTGGWDLVEETAEVQGAPDDIRWERRPPFGGDKLLATELALY